MCPMCILGEQLSKSIHIMKIQTVVLSFVVIANCRVIKQNEQYGPGWGKADGENVPEEPIIVSAEYLDLKEHPTNIEEYDKQHEELEKFYNAEVKVRSKNGGSEGRKEDEKLETFLQQYFRQWNVTPREKKEVKKEEEEEEKDKISENVEKKEWEDSLPGHLTHGCLDEQEGAAWEEEEWEPKDEKKSVEEEHQYEVTEHPVEDEAAKTLR